MQLIVSSEDDQTPAWSGWNTMQCRLQGHAPATKSHIVYHPLLMAKPSDPSTVYTSIIKARDITRAAGQKYTILTADQQLFKVAIRIKWNEPDEFDDVIPRLGGMHFLTNVISCIGNLAADTGCAEILCAAFSGVAKMLARKKYPQNFRAMILLCEELLRPIFTLNTSITSMPQLQTYLDTLCIQSRTSKLWIDVIIRLGYDVKLHPAAGLMLGRA